MLSARWLIAFIFTLIIGYCSWFVFYYSNHEGAKRRLGVFALVGLRLRSAGSMQRWIEHAKNRSGWRSN